MNIIDSLLGEEGMIKYNVVKNRLSATQTEAGPENLLHLYGNFKNKVDYRGIASYRENMEKLHDKIRSSAERNKYRERIESFHNKIKGSADGGDTAGSMADSRDGAKDPANGGSRMSELENSIMSYRSSMASLESMLSGSKDVDIATIITYSSSGTSPSKKRDGSEREGDKKIPASLKDRRIGPSATLQEAISVDELMNLESLKFANIFGQVEEICDDKKTPILLEIQNGKLRELCPKKDKNQRPGNPEYTLAWEYEIPPCKLFVVSRKKTFLSFLRGRKTQMSFVPLGREMDIMNVLTNKNGYEMILKNTQTARCKKIFLESLEICVQDGRFKNHFYKIEKPDSFIRWVLALKLRIDSVEFWAGNELWSAIK